VSKSAEDIEDRLADFTQDRRILLLSGMAVVVGVLSACLAKILVALIALLTNLAYHHRLSAAALPMPDHLGAWSVLIPVAGGLVIGLMARFGSDRIRGHGIPEALEAILVGRSRMSPKVAVLKPLSSAISIGTGGPFGAEGPIIMTGGAFGSLFAQFFHLSSAERKTLLVAGAAGGMAAIFAAPLAAVLLAVELLLFEWKPRSFIPVAIAAAVAAALRVPMLGAGPIFPVVPHTSLPGGVLVLAFALGIVSGLASGLLTALVYGFEDLFHRLPFHWMWWPAIGGLCVGLGGLIEPHALGVGYPAIHALLRGDMADGPAARLLLVKALIWAIALGSGTSGGVLAPLLIMGGGLGALASGWLPLGDRGLWAMLGMAAMMGGTMRSPLTAILFALELTHDLNALPALMLACVAAHGVTVLLLKRSILTEKISRRGLHLTRELGVDPLAVARVQEIMSPDLPTIPATSSVRELMARIHAHDPSVTRRAALLVVDEHGVLTGVVTRGDLLRELEENPESVRSVLAVGSRSPIVAYPDETVHDAAMRMMRHGVGRLPVVARAGAMRPIGYLGRAEIMSARMRHVHEESVREPGWIDGLTRS
jgi:H+/Cl- antiporter ClcA/CBS domain-containing protein